MPDMSTILLIVAMFALMYFLLIRPQQKRSKEQQSMLAALEPGSRVMTISGIVGTIKYLGEKQAIIEIAPGVEMTVVKAALSTQKVEDEFEYADDADGQPEPVSDGPADTVSQPAASAEPSEPADPTEPTK